MKVADIMMPTVATVRPDTLLVDAIDLMLEKRISGLPVVDGIGAPIGILTEGDLLRRIELGTDVDSEGLLEAAGAAAGYVRSHGRHVRDVMTKAPVTVPDTAPVSKAIAMMHGRKIRRLLVICDGILAGIVTRADLMRALGRMLRREGGREHIDRALEAKIREELALLTWLSGRVTVMVSDGVAELAGNLPDAQQRRAVLIMRENTGGIKAVRMDLSPAPRADIGLPEPSERH